MLTSSTGGSSLNSLFQPDLDSRSRLSQPPSGSRSGRIENSGIAGPNSNTDLSNSFAAQLAQTIERYLNSPGNSSAGSPLQIEITPTSGQNIGATSGSRQFLVTVRDPGTAGGPSNASPGIVSPDTTVPQNSLSDALAAVTVKTPATTAVPATTTQPVYKNEADAYWATQPPAVQVLRTISNESERTAKAEELTKQGYAIDVPIMLWNLDPLSIMSVRKAGGMTWIPAMGQVAPETGPGINFPGMTSYDPAHPPAGSIPVSTDWANGLESTSPWFTAGATS